MKCSNFFFLKHEAWLLYPLLMDNGVAIHKIKNKNYFAFTVLLSKQNLTERERRTLVRRGTEVVGVQVLMRVKNERAKY